MVEAGSFHLARYATLDDVELSELKVTRYAVDARVATITLHRPDRLNAWTGRMHVEYRSLLQGVSPPTPPSGSS